MSHGTSAPLQATVPFVAPENFVLATRDTGYTSLSAAIAELVDNALQASARHIQVFVKEIAATGQASITVGVLDDGSGMSASTLGSALQFGGTPKFGDRSGIGRFGMGLPNSSVSQTRRFEVYSWQDRSEILHTYLDVDEIVTGNLRGIPEPRLCPLPMWITGGVSKSGTLVLWTRCDRLGRMRIGTIAQRLARTLGRLYRFSIWSGVRLSVNDSIVEPHDPLFLDERAGLHGARPYGTPMRYEIRTPRGPSVIEVRFSELPVEAWRDWTTEDKRRRGVVGGAGVSIVRAGREIDYGWHLLGSKRRENYDDWWRCEIKFSAELDELFGVTHSKQGVTPRADLRLALAPDLERIARELNRRVRDSFAQAKHSDRPAATAASRNDAFLVPPASIRARTVTTGGLRYRLRYEPIPDREFYSVRLAGGSVIVTVNTEHPFFTEMYQRAAEPSGCGVTQLESLVLAAARADLEVRDARERAHVTRLRRAWSDALVAFLRH